MARKYLTPKKTTGFKAILCNDDKSDTGYVIQVPYNSPKGFSIGSLSFDVMRDRGFVYAIPKQHIPLSWFINLNEV